MRWQLIDCTLGVDAAVRGSYRTQRVLFISHWQMFHNLYWWLCFWLLSTVLWGPCCPWGRLLTVLILLIIYTRMISDSTFHSNRASPLGYLGSKTDAISDDWMANNSLQLNADKTEILVVAPAKVTPTIMKSIGPLSTAAHSNLHNFGVIFDQSLSFHTHVRKLTRSEIYCFNCWTRDAYTCLYLIPHWLMQHTFFLTLFVCSRSSAVNRKTLLQDYSIGQINGLT